MSNTITELNTRNVVSSDESEDSSDKEITNKPTFSKNKTKQTISANKLKLYDVIIIDKKDYFMDEFNLIYDENRTIVGVNANGENILFKQSDLIVGEAKRCIINY